MAHALGCLRLHQIVLDCCFAVIDLRLSTLLRCLQTFLNEVFSELRGLSMAYSYSTRILLGGTTSIGLLIMAGCAGSPERIAQLDESIAVMTGALGILNNAKDIANAGNKAAAVPSATPAAPPVAAAAPVQAALSSSGSPELAAFENCQRAYLAANRADLLPQCAALLPPPAKSARAAPSR